jgi:hypothetical protein
MDVLLVSVHASEFCLNQPGTAVMNGLFIHASIQQFLRAFRRSLQSSKASDFALQ